MSTMITILMVGSVLFVVLFLGAPLYVAGRMFHRRWWWTIFWLIGFPLALLWTYHEASRIYFAPPPRAVQSRPVVPGGGTSIFQATPRYAATWAAFALRVAVGAVPVLVLLWWHPLRSRARPFTRRTAMRLLAVIGAVALLVYPGVLWINAHGQLGTYTKAYWQRYGFAFSLDANGRPRYLNFTGWDGAIRVKFDHELIPQIAALTTLTKLKLENAGISDDEFIQLAPLTNLTELILNGNQLSDRSLGTLEGFTNLKTLSMSNTQITDACVPVLTKLPHLESVWLPATVSRESSAQIYQHTHKVFEANRGK